MSEIINSSLKTTVKSTAVVLFGVVVSYCIWFITKVLIVRNTTKEELGIYSIVVAMAGILSTIACLGIPEGVPRYIAIFLGENKEREANSASRTAIKVGVLSGALSFLLLSAFSGIIARYIFYKPQIETPLLVMSFFIPLSILVSILVGILRGHNIIYPKVYFLDMGQPFFFLMLLCVIFAIHLPFISILYAYTLAMIPVFIFTWLCYSKEVGISQKQFDSAYGKELIKFSAPLLIANVLNIFLLWCDTLMLGRYTGAQIVGSYTVGITLARVMTIPLGALAFVFMPLAGRMYAQEQFSELKRIYQILTKWNFFVTLPIFFVLFFFPEMTITFLFGERFLDAATPLRMLAIAFLFHASLGTNGTLLIVLGLSKTVMTISAFGVLLNILFNYVLIKRLGLGIMGAAVATLVSYVLLNVMTSIAVYRRSGIHPVTAGYMKPVVGSAVMGLAMYALVKSLPIFSVWLMPLYLALFLGGYIFCLLVTRSLDREDIFLFVTVTKKLGLDMVWLRKILGRFSSE